MKEQEGDFAPVIFRFRCYLLGVQFSHQGVRLLVRGILKDPM